MTKEEVRKTVQKELFVLQDLKYRLKLGKGGALGTAKWDGQHSVRITEGEVNGKIGMTIKCSNSTKVVVDVEPAA